MMMMMNRSSSRRSSSRRSRSKQVSRVVGQTPERGVTADCGARPAGRKICLQNPVIKVAAAAAAAAAAGAREPGLTKFRQKARFKI